MHGGCRARPGTSWRTSCRTASIRNLPHHFGWWTRNGVWSFPGLCFGRNGYDHRKSGRSHGRPAAKTGSCSLRIAFFPGAHPSIRTLPGIPCLRTQSLLCRRGACNLCAKPWGRNSFWSTNARTISPACGFWHGDAYTRYGCGSSGRCARGERPQRCRNPIRAMARSCPHSGCQPVRYLSRSL